MGADETRAELELYAWRMQTSDICTGHESQSAWSKPKVCRTWTDDMILGLIPILTILVVFVVFGVKGR